MQLRINLNSKVWARETSLHQVVGVVRPLGLNLRLVLTHGVDGVDVVEIRDGVDVVNVPDVINGVACCRSSATKAYSHKCTQRGLKSFHDSHACKF